LAKTLAGMAGVTAEGRSSPDDLTKERVMNFKSEVSNMTDKLAEQRGELTERAEDMRRKLAGWGDRTRGFIRTNPGLALVGAFAVGFVLARAARHA
jgi:hypothetical protein